MEIRFVSTLTPEDEERIATLIIEAAKGILAILPISYKLEIKTIANHLCEHEQIGGSPLPAGGSAGRVRLMKHYPRTLKRDDIQTSLKETLPDDES
jgi:hypothetical protein